jgi:hypothetical protein
MAEKENGRDRWTLGGILFCVLIGLAGATQAAEKECKEFNLANPPEAQDLGIRLVGLASAGIILVTEFAEPKPLKITAAALGGTVAAFDLVSIVRKYLGGTDPVTLCPRGPNQSPVLGTDRSLTDALALGKPKYPPSLLDRNAFSNEVKLFDSPLFSDIKVTGLGAPLGAQKPGGWQDVLTQDNGPLVKTPPGLPAFSSGSLAKNVVPNFEWPPKSSLLLPLDGSVSGRIIDGATGGSLVDAVVKLTGPDQGLSLTREAVTTSAGTYRFDALPRGSFLLSVRHAGYSSSNRKLEVAQGEAVGDQDVTLANTAYPCDFSVVNQTSAMVFLHREGGNDPLGLGSAISPHSSLVLSSLDQRRQVSADSFARVRWGPFWIECGGRNSVALLPPRS